MKDCRNLLIASVIALVLALSLTARADEALVQAATWKIIVVKPDSSVWSTAETNGEFYSVQWIENEFQFMPDPNANIVFPYAVYSNRLLIITQEVVGASATMPLAATGVRIVHTNRVCVTDSEYEINPAAKSEKDKKLRKNTSNFGKNIKP